jgi:hypothetical protein
LWCIINIHMGLFGFTSSQERVAPTKSAESSVEKNITGLDSVRVIQELDCTADGKFLTPTNAVSEYSEKDWKTLRTEGFLNAHPQWKELYESQKEWQDLAIKETLMQRQYGHHIDDRNRFLDSLRFSAVEKGELSKEMIEKIGKEAGYESPSLASEIYDRYEREIRNRGAIPPEDPSEAYQKYTALERRDRIYIEKLWRAAEIAKGLREQDALEKKQQAKNNQLSVESQAMIEKKTESNLEQEAKLKARLRESISHIPLLDRMQWRPGFAGTLRELRNEHADIIADMHNSTESVRQNMNAQYEEKIADVQSETMSAMQKLAEAQNSFEALKNIPDLTKEEITEAHKEGEDAISSAINALILQYKAPTYDEAGTKKRAIELEEKIAQLAKNIPYLNDSGEPNRETLQKFVS